MTSTTETLTRPTDKELDRSLNNATWDAYVLSMIFAVWGAFAIVDFEGGIDYLIVPLFVFCAIVNFIDGDKARELRKRLKNGR